MAGFIHLTDFLKGKFMTDKIFELTGIPVVDRDIAISQCDNVIPHRDNVIPQCDINSLTHNSLNSLNSPNKIACSTRDDFVEESSSTRPSAPLGREQPEDQVVLDRVSERGVGSTATLHPFLSGIEVQMRPPTKEGNISFHVTTQTHEEVTRQQGTKLTGYLYPRNRGRDFKRATPLDHELYNLTLDKKHLYIGCLTERGKKGIRINDVTLIYDPTTNNLVFCFTDGDEIIVPTTNKSLTPEQTKNYTSSGYWGMPVQLASKRATVGFYNASTKVREE